ncbi:hypothetical protein Ddye_030080 [Dipteronia dyeriana]|uniref:Protein kinase domain-containing protein n=1 Tax=Dipteronia dyeriana TaxID=168575 RepID=A0AAD9TGQ1_9ROSI|nr:hypothetical protein Ddye_030080 [Dipteronia dyeriana]
MWDFLYDYFDLEHIFQSWREGTMWREESSNFSTFFLFSLLSFLFVTETQARNLQPVICSSSCGDIKNISYPFRLKSDPAGCGDPDYELSCQSNKTIMEFHSGKYYVEKISYSEQIIRIVDVNLASGSCGLPYKSLSVDVMLNDIRYGGQVDTPMKTASFVNCSRNISDRHYRKVPCFSGDQSVVYVSTAGYAISLLPEPCFFISMVPTLDSGVDYPSYETTWNLLKSGFDLGWSVQCRDCFAAGDLCFPSTNSKPYTYNCYKTGYSFITSILSIIFSSLVTFLLAVGLISRFIFIPIVLIVFLIHKYRATRKTVNNVEEFLHKQQSWMPKRFSYIEIIAITNHFRDKLGQGGFGSVYKGQLSDGSSIAVKVLENSSFTGEEFINEVSTIGRIHHVNVVRLLGFCSEGSKRSLVYEYMPNGSLDRHIFSKKGTGESFSWEKLHEIALGTARGIEYLHNGCDMCILHFDIKPHNILLDCNFIPKVADFGLAKFYPKEKDFVCVSALRGTIGYIAPELTSKNFGAVSCKSDVYSFGMLLLEMAGGRRNSYAKATCSSKAYFPSWVYDQLTNGEDLELPDVSEIEVVIARKLCIIGLWCIQVKAAHRPSITKVVEMLEGSIDDLQMPPTPFFSSSPQHNSIREIQSDSSTEWLRSESIEECSYSHQS